MAYSSAIIGGSALLLMNYHAPISVASAVEGIRTIILK
jgi:hypothetical protein